MKVLITHDCAVPTKDGAEHCPANSVLDTDTDIAHAVVNAGRALYIDPKDDPSRVKARTAPEARVEAVRKALKAAAKSEAKPDA